MFSRAIAVLTAFILARILGPEQYGFYALVIALAGTINVFQEFGVGQGAVNLLARARARSDSDQAKDILKFFFVMSAFGLLTTGLAGFLLAPYLGQRFYDDRYLGILASIAVAATALTFFYPLATTALQVARKIKNLALIETLYKFFTAMAPLLLVLAGFGVMGIMTGQFLAMILASFMGFAAYWRLSKQEAFFPKFRDFLRTDISWTKIKEYLRYCVEIAVSKDLIKLNATIPILFVGAFLSTNSALAYYKIALAYVSLQLLLTDPITKLLNVQFPKTEVAGTDKLFRRFYHVSGSVFVLMIALSVLMVLAAPIVIRMAFPEYTPAIPLVYALAVLPVISSLGVGLGPLFRTLNKMKIAIVIQLITITCLVPASYYLIKHYSIRGLIITTLVFTLLPNLLSLIYFYGRRKNI